MRNKILAATTQFNHKAFDKEYNLKIMEGMCRDASSKGIQIITFPEMCITGYWYIRDLGKNKVKEMAEPLADSPSIEKLQNLAEDLNLIIGAGLIELADDGKLYNTYVVVQPDRPLGFHRKLHCFISPHMSSGSSFTVVETSLGIKLGILICWDNNLIENGRMTALAGADILLAPHQTGGCKHSSGHVLGTIDVDLWENRAANPQALRNEFSGIKGKKWLERWLPARAHDNGYFLMFSNGVGRDDDEIRTGNAMLIDCFGEILVQSSSIENDMVIAEFDMTLLEKSLGRNWIKGRRPELYKALAIPSGNEKDPRYLKFRE